jgi:hypothetical protein
MYFVHVSVKCWETTASATGTSSTSANSPSMSPPAAYLPFISEKDQSLKQHSLTFHKVWVGDEDGGQEYRAYFTDDQIAPTEGWQNHLELKRMNAHHALPTLQGLGSSSLQEPQFDAASFGRYSPPPTGRASPPPTTTSTKTARSRVQVCVTYPNCDSDIRCRDVHVKLDAPLAGVFLEHPKTTVLCTDMRCSTAIHVEDRCGLVHNASEVAPYDARLLACSFAPLVTLCVARMCSISDIEVPVCSEQCKIGVRVPLKQLFLTQGVVDAVFTSTNQPVLLCPKFLTQSCLADLSCPHIHSAERISELTSPASSASASAHAVSTAM